MDISIIIFIAFLVITLLIGFVVAKGRSTTNEEFYLADRSLKWYTIALSAGATANSGFIMTTAIALGYLQGVSALLLPLAFLIGTLAFWQFFPERVTKLSHEKQLKTIAETLTHDFSKHKSAFALLTSFLLVLATGLYTAAQWRASAISLTGFIDFDLNYAIIASGLFVASYSMMGGFRSSVWTDVFQAVIMFVMVFFFVYHTYNLYPDKSLIFDTLTQKDKGFLNFFNGYTLMSGLGFIIGWACASMGFSISQPQIIDRFYAAENPKEASKAKWLYIGFVQITWVGMTLVGVLLSGLVLNLDFPTSEKALSTVIAKDLHPIIKGITLTAIFAAIASTADSLLISVSNSISNDLLKPILKTKDISHFGNRIILLLTAVLTVGLAVFFVNGSVFDLVMSSIMLLGSSIAPAMIIKLMQWKNSQLSLFLCILTGLATALLWKYQFVLSGHLNETVPAIVASLTTNWLTYKLTSTDEK